MAELRTIQSFEDFILQGIVNLNFYLIEKKPKFKDCFQKMEEIH